MEAAAARRPELLKGEEAAAAAAAAAGGNRRPLSGQSYWLDLWLFILFDLALLVFVYLLP